MSKEPTEKHELFDIIVKEVSIVDSPANMRKFLLLKSADGTRYAMGNDGCIPIFKDDAFVISPEMTMRELLNLPDPEDKLRKLAKIISEGTPEEVEAILNALEDVNRDLDHKVALSKMTLEERLAEEQDAEEIVEQFDACCKSPWYDLLGTLRSLRKALAGMPTEEEVKDEEARNMVMNFRKFFTVPHAPVQKAASVPPITVNVTVPNNSNRTVTFQRDADGKITGATTE